MIVVLGLVVVLVVLVMKRRQKSPRTVTAKTVAHVMQLPELDGPRYGRRRPRKFRNDGKP